VFSALAAPVVYRGMPLPRLWAFEDAAVDFGAVSAPVEDVTTTLMIEFALRYGNDHWIAPVPLAVGKVCRLDSLVVINGFGETILVRPVADIDGVQSPFRLFEHYVDTSTPARDATFVLFPTLDHVVSGAPLEELHYLREAGRRRLGSGRIAVGPTGLPMDRTQAALAGRAGAPPSMTTQEYAEATRGRASPHADDVPAATAPLLPPEPGRHQR
jgi:hypothetical protein